MLKIIFESLSKDKLRSLLTLIGIIIGIATAVIVLGLTQGFLENVNNVFSNFGSDKITVIPISQSAFGSFSTPLSFYSFDLNDIQALRALNFVQDISYGAETKRTKIRYEDEEVELTVIPITFNLLHMGSNIYKIKEGTLPNLNEKNIAILGSSVQNFFTKPLSVGKTIYINDQAFKIKGILQSTGFDSARDSTIFINFDDGPKIGVNKKNIFFIFIDVSDSYDIEKASDQVKETLKKTRNIGESQTEPFTVITQKFIRETIGSTLNTITTATFLISLIAGLVSAVGIGNTMFTVVARKKREIAIMRALGATKKDIITMFLLESVILTSIGSIIGLIIGYSLGLYIGYLTSLNFSLSILGVSIAIFVGIIIGIIGGFIPAYNASSISPVEAAKT
jgi:putative ABC transport system permease protein